LEAALEGIASDPARIALEDASDTSNLKAALR
jgi:hypothetical protein